MQRIHSITLSGPTNTAIADWTKKNLSDGGPECKKAICRAAFSSLPNQSVTLTAIGYQDQKIIGDETQMFKTINHFLVEETVYAVISQHNIAPFSLRAADLARLGNSKNCLALRLKSDTYPLHAVNEDIIDEMNKLKIFKPIDKNKKPFSIHLKLGYKRMDSLSYKEFQNEIIRLMEQHRDSEANQQELKNILAYTDGPLNQIHSTVRNDLLKLGFSPVKLEKIQQSLAITEEELKNMNGDFGNTFPKAEFTLECIQYVSRYNLTRQSDAYEKIIFRITLSSIPTSLPDPIVQEIIEKLPNLLKQYFQTNLMLAGSRTRGTALPQSDWDILLPVVNNSEILFIRDTVSTVLMEIFHKNKSLSHLKCTQETHSIGFEFTEQHEQRHIDLVPIITGITSPYSIFDTCLQVWKPCYPNKAKDDLDQHPHPLLIRYLIRVVKIWNTNSDSRLKSFHIERMLLRMPCSNLPNLLTALGLAFNFIAHHLTVPLCFDEPLTCINNYLDPAHERRLQKEDVEILTLDLHTTSTLCRMTAAGVIPENKLIPMIFYNFDSNDCQQQIKAMANQWKETDAICDLYRRNKEYKFPPEEIFVGNPSRQSVLLPPDAFSTKESYEHKSADKPKKQKVAYVDLIKLSIFRQDVPAISQAASEITIPVPQQIIFHMDDGEEIISYGI